MRKHFSRGIFAGGKKVVCIQSIQELEWRSYTGAGCKPGRGSHHPFLTGLREAHLILHGWLWSGNTKADSGAVELLKGALAKRENREMICRVRADAALSLRSY
jgi:hypothetical protein